MHARTPPKAKQTPPKVSPAATLTSLPQLADFPGNGPTAAKVQRLLVTNASPQVSARTPVSAPVVLTPFLPELPHEQAARNPQPSETAINFIVWLQTGLAQRKLNYNETGAMVHFVPEGMALVSPAIFKEYVSACLPDEDPAAMGLQVQRAVIQAGWHLVGPSKINILSYQVIGRSGAAISKLSAVVLLEPQRWVTPVPPHNAVLKRT